MGRRISPELLERVRNQLRNDEKEQQRYRDFATAMGGDPNKPYEPDEFVVRTHAGRIAAKQEKERLHDELAAERPAITAMYAEYKTATPERRLELAVILKPLLTERIADLAKRAHATSYGFRCGSRGDPIEDLHTDMIGLECVLVLTRMFES